MTLLLSLLVLTQVPTENQPDLNAFRVAVKEARAKRPLDSKALLAIKQGPIESSLAADLSKYDWYEAGGWSYPEKTFGPGHEEEEPYRYHLVRYLADGSELSYSFSIDRLDPAKAVLNHVNFTLPPPISAAIKVIGKQTYFEKTVFGEKERHRVVSYEKGILILDISYDGKVNSKTVKFRDALVAMPRLFESVGK